MSRQSWALREGGKDNTLLHTLLRSCEAGSSFAVRQPEGRQLGRPTTELGPSESWASRRTALRAATWTAHGPRAAPACGGHAERGVRRSARKRREKRAEDRGCAATAWHGGICTRVRPTQSWYPDDRDLVWMQILLPPALLACRLLPADEFFLAQPG